MVDEVKPACLLAIEAQLTLNVGTGLRTATVLPN